MSKITENTPWGTPVIVSPQNPIEYLTRPIKRRGIYLGHVKSYENIISVALEHTKNPQHFAAEFWMTVGDPLLGLVDGYRQKGSALEDTHGTK